MGLFTPDTSGLSTYFDRARFLLAWRISLLFTIVFGTLSLVFMFGKTDVLLAFMSPLPVSIFSMIYLRITKNFRPLFLVYTIAGTVISHIATNSVLGSVHYADFLWMTTSVLLAFVGLGVRYGVVFMLINILGIGVFIFYSLNNHIVILQPQSPLELMGVYLEILLALFCIAYLLILYLSFQNYSETQLKKAFANLEVQNSLILSRNKEKTVLVKEIHHRVKNNLQIIVSLLRMQKHELKSEDAQKHFGEAINRIMTMSLIHQRLYQEDDLAHINTTEYIQDLFYEIRTIYHEVGEVNLNVQSEVDSLGLKTIVPFGLLLNELMSNSFKHAFKESGEKNIKVEIKKTDEGKLSFNYCDNGNWKEEDGEKNGFGLELIQTLTEQLEGQQKRISDDKGTHYHFTISDLDLDNE